MRRLGAGKLVIASHNEGKVREIGALLAPFGIETVSAAALDLPEPDEIGNTFIDNADLKARSAADLSGFPALADDSGLCIDALEGQPGIYSARWAGPGRDFGVAMERAHEALLAKGPDAGRDAHFVCALAVAWPDDGQCENFAGRVDGILVWPPRGQNGFGYDAMFQPIGYEQTFGEMAPDAKHEMSHRAEAFRKLVAALIE